MRNLKKVLSLALALVMLLGMMVVGAGAAVTTTKDYSDADSVTYTEAIDVMSAIGVFNGSGGKFDPQGNLTRAQAAKIITYMLLGQESAEKLGTLTAPYADVAANYWAAGSIAYCSNMGIVSGIGGGKFGPDAQVTGYQFAKMLLVALGYDAEREGLTGKDWSIAVSRLAITAAGLDTGIGNVDISLDKALTREEAAQMAFNTLKATMVEYGSESTSITVGGTPIVIGGSNASHVLVVNQSYGSHFAGLGTNKNQTIEFGERYFQNLYCNVDTDEFGRPARTWQIGREDIGTYANSFVFNYTNDCTGGPSKTALENELRNYTFGNGVSFTVNGLYSSFNFGTDEAPDNRSAVRSAADVAKLTGNGVLVEVYANDNRVVTKVVVVNTYLMSVKKVSADEVTLAKVGNVGPAVEAVKKDDVNYAALSALKADDYVLIVPVYDRLDNNNDPVYVVNSVALPQIVNGALSRVDKNKTDNSTTAVTVAGTSYSLATNKTGVGDVTLANVTANHLTSLTKKDAMLYLDSYGYAVLIKDVDTVTNYMYVTSTYQSLVNNKVVTMLRGVSSSGEMVEINVGSPASGNATTSAAMTPKALVTYAAASSDQATLYGAEYKATVVAAATISDTNGRYVDIESTNNIEASDNTLKGTTYYYSNNVKFIYYDADNNTVTVLDGVQKKNETVVGAKALLEHNAAGDPLVTAVFLPTTAPDGIGANVMYISAYKGTTSVNNSTVTLFEVIIDGEKKTISVKGDRRPIAANGANAIYAGTFYAYSHDEATDVYNLGAAAYADTSKATAVRSAEVLARGSIVNNQYINLTKPSLTLNAANAVVIDTRAGGKVESVKELAELLATANPNTVKISVIYNGDTTSKDYTRASYIFVTDATVPSVTPSTPSVNGTVSSIGDESVSGGAIAGYTVNATGNGANTKTSVTLTNQFMTDVLNASGADAGADIKVSTDGGTVTLPKEAVKTSGALNGKGAVMVEVSRENIDAEEVPEGTVAVGFSVSVTTAAGGAITSEISSTPITYTTTIAKNLDGVVVYRVVENGANVRLTTGVTYDKASGTLTVVLNHLSTFAVVAAAPDATVNVNGAITKSGMQDKGPGIYKLDTAPSDIADYIGVGSDPTDVRWINYVWTNTDNKALEADSGKGAIIKLTIKKGSTVVYTDTADWSNDLTAADEVWRGFFYVQVTGEGTLVNSGEGPMKTKALTAGVYTYEITCTQLGSVTAGATGTFYID